MNDGRTVLAVLLGALILSGCKPAPETPTEDPAAAHARCEVEQGPVRVTAEIQPVHPRLSDLPTLTLTVDHEEGVTVQKPLFGTKIDTLTIRDLREPLPKSENGRVMTKQIYTLQPTEIGRVRIDPIPFTYADHRPSGDNREHTIETKPLSVEITSLLGDKTPKLGDLRGPASPVSLDGGIPSWAWAILAVAVVAAVMLLRRRRRIQPETYVPRKILTAEELANMELDKLVASGLAETDVKQFFIELTGIVRRYIERTTYIRASEQTTEEFLREFSRRSPLSLRERARVRAVDEEASPSSPPVEANDGGLWDKRLPLQYFLEAADLVKFAAHRPNSEDIGESVRRARLFIGNGRSTATNEVCATGSASAAPPTDPGTGKASGTQDP